MVDARPAAVLVVVDAVVAVRIRKSYHNGIVCRYKQTVNIAGVNLLV